MWPRAVPGHGAEPEEGSSGVWPPVDLSAHWTRDHTAKMNPLSPRPSATGAPGTRSRKNPGRDEVGGRARLVHASWGRGSSGARVLTGATASWESTDSTCEPRAALCTRYPKKGEGHTFCTSVRSVVLPPASRPRRVEFSITQCLTWHQSCTE